MGLFDEVLYSASLSDCSVVLGEMFQTKSLGCGMDRYTITAQRRLVLHRLASSAPASLAVETADLSAGPDDVIDTEYHGDLLLVALSKGAGLVECVARFTHGTLEWIRPVESLTELHRRLISGRW
jgi:hypothetical protein